MINYTEALQKIETYLSSPGCRELSLWLRLEWLLEQFPQTFPPRVLNDQERVEAFDRALTRVKEKFRLMRTEEEWFYEI